MVHASTPYSKAEYVAFYQSSGSEAFLPVNMLFILTKFDLVFSILDLISMVMSHRLGTIVPKYVYFSTCSMGVWFSVSLSIGIRCFTLFLTLSLFTLFLRYLVLVRIPRIYRSPSVIDSEDLQDF